MEEKIVNEVSKSKDEDINPKYMQMAQRIIKKSEMTPEEIISKFLERKVNIPMKPGDGSFIDGSKNKISLKIQIPKNKSKGCYFLKDSVFMVNKEEVGFWVAFPNF